MVLLAVLVADLPKQVPSFSQALSNITEAGWAVKGLRQLAEFAPAMAAGKNARIQPVVEDLLTMAKS